jgi:acyl carrier protein
MVFDVVSHEINAIRIERGLSELRLDRSTDLQDLGFDSLMYTILVTRLEEQLASEALVQTGDEFMIPSTVGDFVDLFGSAKRR